MGCSCKGNTLSTRTSCLECVEKHVGAATVLIGEVLNGYPYRLLAIGHLHEAEEESDTWPALRMVIRQARVRYQNNNTAPNWKRIHEMIVNIDPSRHGEVIMTRPDYLI